jgi:hypothetical protein
MTHLAVISTPDWLEDTLTRVRIIDQRIPLGSMNKLEMLCAIATEDRFLGRHVVLPPLRSVLAEGRNA